MKFEWDPAKATANFAKHHVTFEFATLVFIDSGVLFEDASSPSDAEPREMAVGMIHGRLYAVVHVMRSEVCRIISARPAEPKEARRYASG